MILLFKIMFLSSMGMAYATSEGLSEVAIQYQHSWLNIYGASAKALYDALKVPVKNDQGEAGSEIFFKFGETYSCRFDSSSRQKNDAYTCTIAITNPERGKIGKAKN